jgi:hypothetical protein
MPALIGMLGLNPSPLAATTVRVSGSKVTAMAVLQ